MESNNRWHFTFNHPRYFLYGFIILVFGITLTLVIADNTRTAEIKKLSSFSEMITTLIDHRKVATITATSLDNTNPDYVLLNQQLEDIQSNLNKQGIRWAYLVFNRGNRYVFSVDSIPEGHFGDALPGDPYPNPPLELTSAFINNRTTISRRYQDEWGDYISAFVPINDDSHKIIAVAGFDIDYGYYKNAIDKQLVLPIIVSVLSLIFYSLIYFLVIRRIDYSRSLKESEQKFESITESALDPIIMMSTEGDVYLWNTAAEKLYGYSKSEAIGKNLHHLIIPPNEYDIDHSEKLEMFKQTGDTPIFGTVLEFDTIDKLGKIIPVELSISSVKINGKSFAVGIIRDISLRKQNEKQLQIKTVELENSQLATLNILEDVEEEKLRTETLLSSIGDGVIAVDAQAKITYVNQAAEKLLGWTNHELATRSIFEAIVVKDKRGEKVPRLQRPFSVAMKSKKTVFTGTSDSYNYVRHDGSLLPVAISVAPIIDDGVTVGAINVFHNISHEIEVDRMKTEFISLASHQLRTPLSAMKWTAEMLISGDGGMLNSEQREFVTNIYQSNEKMIALVNSLLNISRIESGRIIIDPKPTNLQPLIDGIVKDFKNMLAKRQQKLEVKIEPNLPLINLDSRLIEEVFKNLISNALKYSPDQGKVSISVTKKDRDIVCQVADHGYGIPESAKEHLFQKFFRAENAIKKDVDGNGLGLYLVKSIVESSGGKIWFESKIDQGSVFWFSLPIKGVKPKKGEVSLNG